MRPLPLLGAAGIAIAIVIADDVGVPLQPLRLLAGLALTFLLPGAALLLAIGPPPRPWAALLVVPYSLALAALGGVVVERLGFGLQPASLVAWPIAVTVGGAIVGLLRAPRRLD